MLKPHPRPASAGPTTFLRLAVTALLLGAAGPTAAGAAVVPDMLQPIGIVGNASRPSCTNPTAPVEPTDVVGADDYTYDDFPAAGPVAQQITATAYAFEFLPTVTICSPTFAGIPGAIGGTIATSPKRTRVGTGWRELGGTFAQPATLTPGDVISLPEVDDAAIARLSVARSNDRPTATVSLSDLAPGPSKVAISEDARGLVASLVRADGTTAEVVAKPVVPPPLAEQVSGSRTRWNLAMNLLPGTFAYVSYSTGNDYGDEEIAVATVDPAGSARFALRPSTRRQGRRTTVRLYGFAVNRDAHTMATITCVLSSDRKARPQSATCEASAPDDFFTDEDVASPFDRWGSLRGTVRRYMASGARLVAGAARALRLPRLSGDDATAATVVQAKAPRAHRNAVMGRAVSRVTAAALVAREVPRSPALNVADFEGVRPLASDVNGDGATDFWTEIAPETTSSSPAFRTTAGYVLLSSPTGLVSRRVDLPTGSPSERFESELSAIGDVTGDGIGELIVDLRERHALIPGSRAWTTSIAPIRAPQLSDLEPTDVILQPSASSPGSPYATVDDATGDGRAELVGTDDLGGWYAVASSALRAGTTNRFPTVTRAVPVPVAVKAALFFDPAAPRVDPRVRVIAGQAVSLRWPTVASVKAPEGAVEVAVRTGTGAAVRPPVTVKTPGNAVLLDYDRLSGDFLLLAVAARCTVGSNYIRRRCRETVLRVRADGTIRQRLTVEPRTSISYVGATRFLADGPDADADTEAVLTVGNRALGLVDSSRAGTLEEETIPVTTIVTADTPFYDELRPIPVVGPTGARTLTLALPREVKSRRGPNWSGRVTVPAEIDLK